MNGTRFLVLAMALVVVLPLVADDGRKNPQEGLVVRATGKGYAPKGKPGKIGELMAKRAAKMVALRNLLAKLGRLSPKGDGVGWLQGYVRGARVVSEKLRKDGGWDVTVELPLASLVLRLREENKLLRAQVGQQKLQIEALEKKGAALRTQLDKLTRRLTDLVSSVRSHLEQLGRALKK